MLYLYGSYKLNEIYRIAIICSMLVLKLIDMGNRLMLDITERIAKLQIFIISQFLFADTQFLKSTLLGLELVKEICQETSVLAKYAKILKFNLENEIEKRAAADKVIQDELMTLNEKIKDITQRQEEIIPKHIRGIRYTKTYINENNTVCA